MGTTFLLLAGCSRRWPQARSTPKTRACRRDGRSLWPWWLLRVSLARCPYLVPRPGPLAGELPTVSPSSVLAAGSCRRARGQGPLGRSDPAPASAWAALCLRPWGAGLYKCPPPTPAAGFSVTLQWVCICARGLQVLLVPSPGVNTLVPRRTSGRCPRRGLRPRPPAAALPCGFPHTQQFCATPAGGPLIQFSSNAVYRERVADPTS